MKSSELKELRDELAQEKAKSERWMLKLQEEVEQSQEIIQGLHK